MGAHIDCKPLSRVSEVFVFQRAKGAVPLHRFSQCCGLVRVDGFRVLLVGLFLHAQQALNEQTAKCCGTGVVQAFEALLRRC